MSLSLTNASEFSSHFASRSSVHVMPELRKASEDAA